MSNEQQAAEAVIEAIVKKVNAALVEGQAKISIAFLAERMKNMQREIATLAAANKRLADRVNVQSAKLEAATKLIEQNSARIDLAGKRFRDLQKGEAAS